MSRRDDTWLQQLLDDVWDRHFTEVPQDNIVRIQFGRRTKNRLGSIRLDPIEPDVSIITINGLFKSSQVPEGVVRATIVHELSHYAHGFNSPLQQKFRHPHAGGVMRQEFADRGLLQLYQQQRAWLKDNWAGLVAQELPQPRRMSPRRSLRVPKPFWFKE